MYGILQFLRDNNLIETVNEFGQEILELEGIMKNNRAVVIASLGGALAAYIGQSEGLENIMTEEDIRNCIMKDISFILFIILTQIKEKFNLPEFTEEEILNLLNDFLSKEEKKKLTIFQ